AGLRRCAGNRQLFESMLARFSAEQADASTRIGMALADGDRATAERHAHALRGVAGNLGLRGLQQAAERLEQALRHEAAHEAALKAVEARLAAALVQVRAEMPRNERATSSQRLDAARLERLRRLLADGDAEAEAEFESLREGLREQLRGEQFRALARAVGQFEFEVAHGLLETILGGDT